MLLTFESSLSLFILHTNQGVTAEKHRVVYGSGRHRTQKTKCLDNKT